MVEQEQLHTNFLALKFDEILRSLQVLFYAIWNKSFWHPAHLTDGMRRQKKPKKHIEIDAFYILEVFWENQCSSR